MRIAVLFLFASVFAVAFMESCAHSNKYRATYPTYNCKGLYSNIYDVYWWGIYNERNASAIFITDSSTFRISLGILGEDDRYGCRIYKDTLFIEKGNTSETGSLEITERKKYFLPELKRNYPFDR